MKINQIKLLNDINKIKIYDNFFSENVCDDILNSIQEYPYYRTETDLPGLPKTGMVSVLDFNHNLYKTFLKTLISNNILNEKNYKPYRFYVNLFLKNETCFFHVDSEQKKDITFLYYPSNTDEINYSGNTDFIIDEKIISIPYVRNRLISFPSNFVHRATSFYNKDRFSIALKTRYEKG